MPDVKGKKIHSFTLKYFKNSTSIKLNSKHSSVHNHPHGEAMLTGYSVQYHFFYGIVNGNSLLNAKKYEALKKEFFFSVSSEV